MDMSKNIRIKPGKTQSKIGVAIGVVFCFIGLFFVIPTFGPRGILWTVLAVIITVINGLNGFTEKGVSTHEIVVDDCDNTEFDEELIKEKLKKLKEMYEDELISAEEYEMKKKEILDKL